MPGLYCGSDFSPVAAGGGSSLVAVHVLLIAVASPVAGHGLEGTQTRVVAAPRP